MNKLRARLRSLRPGVNPIIVKELRSRMRGGRAFAILTGVLFVLAGISYLFYRVVLSTMRYSNMPISPQIGHTLLVGLAVVELVMVCFVTPAITAGSISGEKEKLTYEMLLATPLRPASILWGKLISALGYVFLLIFAAIPMASLVFTFGGVTVRDMLKALVILTATAVTVGVIGVTMSCWLGRTVRATVLSYLAVLGLLIGPLLVYVLVGVLRQSVPPPWILVPNPVSALFSALPPVSPYGSPIAFLYELGRLLGGSVGVQVGGGMVKVLPRPLYHYSLPFYGALSLTLYLSATQLVRPTRRWRIHWQDALTAVGLFLALGIGVAVPFLATADRYERVMTSLTSTPTPFMPPAVVERQVVEVVIEPTVAPPPTVIPAPTPTAMLDFSEADQAAIYAAVIRQLYTVDHMHTEPPNLATISVLHTTDDTVGDPEAPRSDPVLLSESIQTAVVEALAGLGSEVRWVEENAMIALGNVHLQEDGSVLVSAQFRYSTAAPTERGLTERGPTPTRGVATGKTYVLEQVDGVWQIVGYTADAHADVGLHPGVQWLT